MERYIHSLRGLMYQFGVEFVVRPKITIAEFKELLKEGKSLRDVIPDGIDVCGQTRTNLWPLMADSGIRYRVTDHDERALYSGETLNHLLNDLVHAAECGCKGCNGRISDRREYYKGRCEA